MGTASRFNDILKEEINAYAAWLPVANIFRLGDYGRMNDGVFTRIGNIQEDHGVTFRSAPGGGEVKLDFTSKGTTINRFTAGATVNAFPDEPVEGKLTIEFGSENAFLLKANLRITAMESIQMVANKLATIPEWKNAYRVIFATYASTKCALISSKTSSAKIEISGKAAALKRFELGEVSADISSTNKSEIGLDIVGEGGVVALGLFKLGWWDNSATTLASGANVPIEKDMKAIDDDL